MPALGAVIPAIAAAALAFAPYAAAASVAVSGVAAGLQYESQRQQAKRQDELASANQQNANNAYRVQQQQIQTHLLQQRSQFAQEDFQRDVQAAQVTSSERASAASAGVSGVSLESIMNNTDRQQAAGKYAIGYNYGISQLDAFNQENNAYYQTLDRRNAVPFGMYPNMAAPILDTAGAAFNALSSSYDPRLQKAG